MDIWKVMYGASSVVYTNLFVVHPTTVTPDIYIKDNP